MLPSRGPIQVTLDDTGSRIQCTKPPAQVKILTRPRNTNTTNAKANGPINSNLETSTITTTNPATQTTNNSSGSSGIISGSILQLASSQDCPNNRNINNSPIKSSYSSACSSNISSNANQHQQHTQPATSNKNRSSSSSLVEATTTNKHNITSSNNSNKKPMKTYQERADEYAKARLRILGSAFPENDDDASLANSDNVNRILNLDPSYSFTSSSASTTQNGPNPLGGSGGGGRMAAELNGGSHSSGIDNFSCCYSSDSNNCRATNSPNNVVISNSGCNSDIRGNYNRGDNDGFYPDSNSRVYKS